MITTAMAAGTAATASGRPRGLTTANASTRIRNNPEMASTASVYGDARRARAFIVRSVRTGSRTPLLQRRGHTRSEPPGVDEEPRVAGATVTWPDRQPLGVPFAHHDLDAARLQPAAMDPQGVHRASQLRGRRDVAAEHAAGLQHLAHRVDALPRREHVEDDAIDRLRSDALDQIADPYVPCRVRPTEEGLDVGDRDLREVGAALVRVELAARTDRPQDRQRQRPRPDPSLEHPGAREDVGVHEDLRGVLRVDHGRATRHRDRVLLEQGAQREVRDALGGRHDDAIGTPDELVMVDAAPGRVERRPRRQLDRVAPALLVEQRYPPPRADRPLRMPDQSASIPNSMPFSLTGDRPTTAPAGSRVRTWAHALSRPQPGTCRRLPERWAGLSRPLPPGTGAPRATSRASPDRSSSGTASRATRSCPRSPADSRCGRAGATRSASRSRPCSWRARGRPSECPGRPACSPRPPPRCDP